MARGGKQPGAGRPKGVPNQVTKVVRESMGNLFVDSLPRIKKALNDLESEPEKYLSAWSKFLPYLVVYQKR